MNAPFYAVTMSMTMRMRPARRTPVSMLPAT